MSIGPDAEAAERLGELLERIVDELGLDAEVSVSREGDLLTGAVMGADVGLFIGRHGQTIDAVRHLARRIVLRGAASALRVEVDADGYRGRRARALCVLADEAADAALRGGRPVPLAAMPAAERRIVHEHLRDRTDVATHSEGEEPERYLVVAPARR